MTTNDPRLATDDDQHFEDGGRRFSSRLAERNILHHLSDLGIEVSLPLPPAPRSLEQHAAEADAEQQRSNEAAATYLVGLALVTVVSAVQLLRALLS